MGNISIVTSFFDIGRSTWTPENGFPDYLYRSNEIYIERFSHLTRLNNEIVVYTEKKFVGRLRAISDKITVIEHDYHNNYHALRNRISEIQKNETFQKLILENEKSNPEYWSADYVLVNMLKCYFVIDAIERGLVTNDTIAWIDFGYCRSKENSVGDKKSWSFDFNPEKIHFFDFKPLEKGRQLINIISTNDVYILGAKIIAHRKKWPLLKTMIDQHLGSLMANGIIDDDQTVLLMAASAKPEEFELHRLPSTLGDTEKIFCVFQDYNRD